MPKPLYCAILASANLGDCGIDRIFVKHKLEEAIRFRRHWRLSLEFAEDEPLILLGDAVAAGIFSSAFLDELRAVLDVQGRRPYAQREKRAQKMFIVQRISRGNAVSALPTPYTSEEAAIRSAKRLQQVEGCSVQIIESKTGVIVKKYRIDDLYLFGNL
jgi:hypothetical protein